MTTEEKQEIVSEVLSALRTNSVLITDLTEVQSIPEGSYIELSGGRRIEAATLIQGVIDAVTNGSLVELIDTERTERQGADSELDGRLDAVEASCASLETNKFNKSDIVEASGSSSTKVMSQAYVSNLFTTLHTNQVRIKLEAGTNTPEALSLVFTKANGDTASVVIGKATTSNAGLMSAADKNALVQNTEDIEALTDAKIDDVSAELDEDSATITVATHDSEDSDFVVTIPKAGTIPQGETDPVAGVMSAEQAQDLDAVVLHVFPLEVTVASSNAGLFEKGTSVTPNVKINIMRRGEGVARNASLVSTMRVDQEADNYLRLTYDAITENTSFNIAVSHKGSTVNVPQQQYRFVNFIYGDVLSAAPEPGSIATHLREARTLSQLSTSTTYSGTLQAGKFFIFGVPGNVTLMCRHSETGAIISGCTTGTVQVARQNNAEITDLYSYIVIPSSDVAWNYKITNS